MDNSLKNLSDLINFTFYIPDYQRGYRWNDDQIDNLLNDLKDFVEQKENDTFFLEPVIVRKINDYEYELIDGQQRLTTIFLLGYILDSKLHENVRPIGFKLAYHESKDNMEFLDRIANDPLAEDWEGSDSCPDYYFIANACRKIRSWLDKPGLRRSALDMLDRLNSDVRFLWHDTSQEPESAAETFERLNTGKIALTDGELCRSLLLIRQNVENELPTLKGFAKEDRNILLPRLRNSLIARRQIIQADNWDESEKLLRNKPFWEFLGAPDGFQTRMDFLLQLHYALKPQYVGQYVCFDKLYNEIGKSGNGNTQDGYYTWGKLKQTLQHLWDWYNDPDYYHWIGYLNRVDKKQLPELLNLAHILSYTEFKNDILKRIKSTICKGDINLDEIQYESGSDKDAWKILFLFNVEYARLRQLSFARFPFVQFSPNQSIEHINARNQADIISIAQMISWMESRREFLKGIEKDEIDASFLQHHNNEHLEKENDDNIMHHSTDHIWKQREKLLNTINNLLEIFSKLKKNDNPSEFKEQFNALFDNFLKFMYHIDGNEEVNSLYNLCLIDKDINTSLGNMEFTNKQQKLRAILSQGKKYVPPATQALFMRHFMKKAFNRSWWSKDDRNAYRRIMHETLSVFWPDLTEKLKEHPHG